MCKRYMHQICILLPQMHAYVSKRADTSSLKSASGNLFFSCNLKCPIRLHYWLEDQICTMDVEIYYKIDIYLCLIKRSISHITFHCNAKLILHELGYFIWCKLCFLQNLCDMSFISSKLLAVSENCLKLSPNIDHLYLLFVSFRVDQISVISLDVFANRQRPDFNFLCSKMCQKVFWLLKHLILNNCNQTVNYWSIEPKQPEERNNK